MKKLIIFLCLFTPLTAEIGGKIHFEEESGTEYLGTREINQITRNILHELFEIHSDTCAPNAKILLTKESDKVRIAHYEEKSRSGIGEELHATLLYTKPRGFCDSETLEQIFPEITPTLECVAKTYSAIIKPEWKLQISKVVFTDTPTNAHLIAELLFEGRPNIYKDSKPISAGLHLTLINCNDLTLLANEEVRESLLQALNKELKDKMVKIATKNGIADLEFGISGSPFRIRALEFKPCSEKYPLENQKIED